MKISSDVWKIEEKDTIYKKDCEKEGKDQPPNTQTCYGTRITRNIKTTSLNKNAIYLITNNKKMNQYQHFI